MADIESKKAAREFAERWKDKGDEKQDTHPFWEQLLQEVVGVENPTYFLNYEKRVKIKGGNTKYIDIYVPSKHVLIEQKALTLTLTNRRKVTLTRRLSSRRSITTTTSTSAKKRAG